MQCGDVFSRVCMSVCVSVPFVFVTFESFVLETLFLVAGTSSGYLGQVHMSRSSAQGQGHMSKKVCLCVLFVV